MAHRPSRTLAITLAACILALPGPALAQSNAPSPLADPHAGHEMAPPEPDPHAGHGDESTSEGGHDHDSTGQDGSHEHEQLPDTVSPEVRNLVLSGFAGVNVAVVFGAWLVRRTRPGDPDPRKRDTRTIR